MKERWKRARKPPESPEDSLGRFVDAKLTDIVEAREYQDWIEAQMQGGREEPPEPPEDYQKRMYEMDTDKELDKLQGVSLLLLFKSSKRLERYSRRLVVLTVALAVLTIILILTAVLKA